MTTNLTQERSQEYWAYSLSMLIISEVILVPITCHFCWSAFRDILGYDVEYRPSDEGVLSWIWKLFCDDPSAVPAATDLAIKVMGKDKNLRLRPPMNSPSGTPTSGEYARSNTDTGYPSLDEQIDRNSSMVSATSQSSHGFGIPPPTEVITKKPSLRSSKSGKRSTRSVIRMPSHRETMRVKRGQIQVQRDRASSAHALAAKRNRKSRRRKSPLYVIALLLTCSAMVLFCFMISNALVSQMLPNQWTCKLTAPIVIASYQSAKGCMYLAFLLRCYSVYRRTKYSYSPWLVGSLASVTFVLNTAVVIMDLTLTRTEELKVKGHPSRRVCVIYIFELAGIIAIPLEFFSAILYVYMFTKPLRRMIADSQELRIAHEKKRSSMRANSSQLEKVAKEATEGGQADPLEDKEAPLRRVALKYTMVTWVASGSTLFLLMTIVVWQEKNLAQVDMVVNTVCLLFLTKWYDAYFEYVCCPLIYLVQNCSIFVVCCPSELVSNVDATRSLELTSSVNNGSVPLQVEMDPESNLEDRGSDQQRHPDTMPGYDPLMSSNRSDSSPMAPGVPYSGPSLTPAIITASSSIVDLSPVKETTANSPTQTAIEVKSYSSTMDIP